MPVPSHLKFGRLSTHAIWYLLLVIVLPAITLLLTGLVYLWQQNLLLVVVAAWLVITAIAYALFKHWPTVKARKINANKGLSDNPNAQTDGALPQQLEAQEDWSDHDNEVWNHCCLTIEAQLSEQLDWQGLPELALAQLTLISQQYHGVSKNAALDFTVPELLLVISVASTRYRQLVIEYVPYIDKISVANANSLLQHKDNMQTGYSWFNQARRTLRLLNPASAVVGELRDLITNKVFTQASVALQTDMKRLLLQEVTQVGIDLYSGKLTTSDQELAGYRSTAAQTDDDRQFVTTEPLRIVLIGQSSAGKSSLINVLTQALQAEVGVLPVTNRITVHELQLEDSTAVNLIDTPGIDGTDDTMALLLEQALEADLIIWLIKATQPARAPDNELYAKLQATWTTQHARLQAPMIMALTHIDQLSPKTLWQPPFDLSSESPKAQSIVAATESAKTRIGFPDNVLSVPVYLGDQYDHYNVDALAAQLMMLAEKSENVQRNRRRIELSSNTPSWHSRWLQAKKLGKVIGQSVVKRV